MFRDFPIVSIIVYGHMIDIILSALLLTPGATASVWQRGIFLTHRQLETYGCIFSTVATDALVLKHQVISVHSAEYMCILLDPLHTEILQL